MRIAAVIEQAQRRELAPLQRKLLDYLEAHKDEVFTYRDEKLVHDTNMKQSAVGFTLWALHKKSLIDKQEVGGKVYFGSKQAVSDLRQSLALSSEDPFERAERNRQRIKERHGNIDVLALLDEVREGK